MSALTLLRHLTDSADGLARGGFLLVEVGDGFVHPPPTLALATGASARVVRIDSELALRHALWEHRGAPLVALVPEGLALPVDLTLCAERQRVHTLTGDEVLSAVPPYRATRRIDRSQYDYYALWYCVPIRELVARDDFVEEPEWIARQLRPPIRPAQAREALDLLQELGLLQRLDGRLQQAEALLTTGPQLRVLAARRFHQQMLLRAEEAMDSMDLEEREVGGVTLRLTKPQVDHLKKRMYEIRQEILQLDGTGAGDQAVHHFAFQLFPVTRWPDGDPDEA